MKSKHFIFFLIPFVAGVSCQTKEPESMKETKIHTDPHSYSKPNQARVEHLNLQLNVDFENQVLSGYVLYDIKKSEDAQSISFDTDELEIESVEDGKGNQLEYTLGEDDPILGSELKVSLAKDVEKVNIKYRTSPNANALQWLNPRQTAMGEQPFLFTQSQAILARSWIPCQDSPGIRFTYEASITVPKGLMALMSAENPQEINPEGTYSFTMPQAIPSYLMALTVGQVEFMPIGERTGVYAEPVMLEKCHNEFSDMEKMLESAEDIYGPYAWGRYDVIILPPSFPFGGMENPRLTFATPTIIAGDKSLTSLIAHEMAHSWSGNLVTNATWDDFWLNEGFTVYFEQRIMEAVYGRPYSEMLALLSFEGLKEEIEELSKKKPADTKLKLDLKGRNPDDGMTAIAYDKGYLFLRKVEETIGREQFDVFLKSYFSSYAFKVMDTERFLELLKNELSPEELKEINIDAWVYGEGLPENHPVISSDRFNRVEEHLNEWLEGETLDTSITSDWSTHEWLHFVNSLPEGVGAERMAALDEKFHLTSSGNSEIQAAWYRTAIQEDYHDADQAIEEFLIKVGRRKFLTPTYKALIQKDTTMERARNIYKKARPNYHSVSTGTLDELLKWES